MQEIYISLPVLKKQIAEAAHDPLCIGIVVAIQPTNPYKKVSLEQVFREVDATEAFSNYAFNIELGYKNAGTRTELIRRRVLSVSPNTCVRTLDAKRFGFFNAEYIQKLSAMPW